MYIRLDIVLDTPVLVLPRSSCSPHVFVAHLGKITLTNIQEQEGDDDSATTPKAESPRDRDLFNIDEDFETVFDIEDLATPTGDDIYVNKDFLKGFADDVQADLETYTIDVRNMNLFSLDTTTRKGFRLYDKH